jgi:acyl-CoA dehydrogenase
MERDPAMLPFARAAIRMQLELATGVLQDIYANLPLGARRVLGWLVMRGLWHLAPLRDRQLLALADTLRTQRGVVARLAPDIGVPKNGGLLDLMQALELYDRLGADEVGAVNKALRQTGSFDAAARAARDPELARAYLRAADKVIQVDDFPRTAPGGTGAVRSADRAVEALKS